MNVLRRMRDDERGAGYLAAFLVLFGIVFLLGVGILVDSARYFAGWRQSGSIALEAARAGANALDAQQARDSGVHVVDPARGQAAAADAVGAFLDGSGVSLDSVTVSGNRVTVRVSRQVGSWFPFMADRTVSQQASATLESGGGP
jgi:hypothetical protein